MMPQNRTHNHNKVSIRIIRRGSSDKNSRCWQQAFLPLVVKFLVIALVVFSLMVDIQASVAPTSSSTFKSITDENSNDIRIVFSDLDGTLIHYPKPKENTKETKGKLLEFPKSSTGLVGVISARTLSLVDEIRNQNNVKFVLISGMRTSTLLQRIPYLPRADAYCSENGGRIFYPVDGSAEEDETKRIIQSIDGDDGDTNVDADVFWVHPKRYRHDGKTEKGGDPHRNRPFGVREDKTWRKKMTTSIGGDSFGPFSLQQIFADPGQSSMPLNERDGLLWDFARDLIHKHDFVLDTKGYSTCFRVNKKQQTSEAAAEFPPSQISALLKNSPWKDKGTIASSVNLSCVDFYPSCSGKKNCCLYLASKFFPEECQPKLEERNETDGATTGVKDPNVDDAIEAPSPEESFLSSHAVCMCDDDNDLEMALACQHAYLPDIASESMRKTIAEFPDHFTTTFRFDTNLDSKEESSKDDENSTLVQETDASDVALSIIWERTNKETGAVSVKRSLLPPTKLSLAFCCIAIFMVLK